jgi:hypothetical protein
MQEVTGSIPVSPTIIVIDKRCFRDIGNKLNQTLLREWFVFNLMKR